MITYLKKRKILKLESEIKPIYKSNKVFFHTYSHINDGLKIMSELPSELSPNDTQIIAWLFHDIVYDVSSSTNEEDSAIYFEVFYKEHTELFSDLCIDTSEVVNIILDTKLHTAERSELSALVLDIDLSCLSGKYSEFKKGRLNVLREYKQIYSNKELFIGTIDFLSSFFNKNIFITGYFKEHYENQAHKNIKDFSKELKNSNIIDTIV